MESVRQTQKKYASRVMTAAIFIGFFLILAGYRPVGKGLILGTLFSIINFVLMGETLPMRLGQSKNKTFFLSIASVMLRYVILAVPIFMGIKNEQFNIVAVIIGIFSIQMLILSEQVLDIMLSSRRKT